MIEWILHLYIWVIFISSGLWFFWVLLVEKKYYYFLWLFLQDHRCTAFTSSYFILAFINCRFICKNLHFPIFDLSYAFQITSISPARLSRPSCSPSSHRQQQQHQQLHQTRGVPPALLPLTMIYTTPLQKVSQCVASCWQWYMRLLYRRSVSV